MDIPDLLKHLLVMDIETAASVQSFDQLEERLKPEWLKKARKFDKEADPASVFEQKAAIFAEFGKIISIGLGYFYQNEAKEVCLRVKALAGNDESQILNDFTALVTERFDQQKLTFVAHNGKDFDFPFLCRRMLINGIKLIPALDFGDKKPWEVPHMDTMQMWKFGELRHYTSLELLAGVFNIPSSKQDMDGSQVSQHYHQGKGLEQIAEYCCNDVVVTSRIFLKMKGLPDLQDKNIYKV